jgi:hexosaminidase
LVAYANARQITIIPEIEMPGHTKALKKSMPDIFFDMNDRSRYLSVQGYNDSVLPICKYGTDSKFTSTLNGIITDIAALFANQTTINYTKNEVSLSGDEVPKEAFTNYAACNEGAYRGLNGESIAHVFFKQLSTNLPGFKLSGWQQLVQSNDGVIGANVLDPKATGHVWEWLPTNSMPVSGLEMSANLSKAGYPTVLDFANLSYFDMRYSTKWEEPGLYWATNAGDTFSALIAGLSIDHIADTSNILGIEGALWSELVPSREHLFYMILPKMSGLADAAWSDKSDISWRSLAVRLGCGKTGFLDYLNKQYNIRYRGYPDGIKLEVPDQKLCN